LKRRVVWSRAALDELKEIGRHIARDNPDAARGVAAAIRATGDALGARSIGRRGRVTGTYEKPVVGVPDILAYALGQTPQGDEAVFILHVIHMAHDWRAESWPE